MFSISIFRVSQVTTGHSLREIRQSYKANGSVRRCSNPTADWVSPSLAVTTAKKNSSRSNRLFRTDPPGLTDDYKRVIITFFQPIPHTQENDESSIVKSSSPPLVGAPSTPAWKKLLMWSRIFFFSTTPIFLCCFDKCFYCCCCDCFITSQISVFLFYKFLFLT